MIDPEFVSDWLEETDAQLQSLTQVVQQWTQSPGDASFATESLRLIHAMEGAAGALRFDNLLAATRCLGSEAERVRDNPTLDPTRQLAPLIDILQNCNDLLRNGETLPPTNQLIEKMKSA